MISSATFTGSSASSIRLPKAVCSGLAAQLVAAVANSGALDSITALTQPTPADLATRSKARDLTDKPFGVNLTILPSITPPPCDEYRRVIVDSGITIVETPGPTRRRTYPCFTAAASKCHTSAPRSDAP